jgi:flagella synthesis protein FlgN
MMDLPSLLRAQDDNLSQMQGLLAEEFDLLKAHRALALPALADRKQQLLVAIEMLDKTLAELPDLQQQLGAFPTQLL